MKSLLAVLLTTVTGVAVAQSNLPQDEAIRAIYGEYDSTTKSVDAKLWHGFSTNSGRISVDVLLTVQIATRHELRAYVVTSAVPEVTSKNEYDCHACEAQIGVGIFRYTAGAWSLTNSNPAAAMLGAWGLPPDVDLIRVGSTSYAVRLSMRDMNAGDETNFQELLGAEGTGVAVIWKAMVHEDNSGNYDPTGREGSRQRICFDTAYQFTRVDDLQKVYDLHVISRGYGYGMADHYASQNWNETYRFQDGKYKLIKRTRYSELRLRHSKRRRVSR